MTKVTVIRQTRTRAERILDGEILPATESEKILARGLYRAQEHGQSIPMIGVGMDHFWKRDIADICAAAECDGYSTLFLADTSTALMGNLHTFAELGWTLGYTVKIAVPTKPLMPEQTIMAIALHKED